MPQENIVIRGATQHNLKNINVTIPRDRLVVITGVSGSGKSSLAFDTIYAEGQRRYVESLSAYARQFLGRMDKPEVEYIEGLSPAISIDQKGVSHNPRSTVGTVTEIYDYLRLLFARAGRPHCPGCGQPVARQTVQQIVDSILNLPKGTRIMVLAPKVRRRKGEHKEVFSEARKQGFARVRVNGDVMRVEDAEQLNLDKRYWHYIELAVDRLIIDEHLELVRVTDSVETALREGGGVVQVAVEGGEELEFSEQFACVSCGTGLPEIEPRTFSFNSPHGACSACTGLGFKLEVDPELVLSNKDLSLREGGVLPWSRAGSSSPWYASMLESMARSYGFSTGTPIRKLTKKAIDIILYGNQGETVTIKHTTQRGRVYSWRTNFEGVIPNLERRFRDTDSDYIRREIERYMAARACQSCKGRRLRPEALSVKVDGRGIMDVCALPVTQALQWSSTLASESSTNGTVLPLSVREKAIAQPILKEIFSRLQFLEDIGLGYLTLDRSARTLSGGEAQRIRLATQIGSGLTGVLYVCDEPTIGLHPFDDNRLIGTLNHLRDLGNTVIVVEHDEAVMRAANHIVDLGPGAGEHGGHVVVTGTIEDVMSSDKSLTGLYLSGRKTIPVPEARRDGNGAALEVKGARENNLKNVNVKFPLGRLVCVTGVSGSGKSTLVYEILYKRLAQAISRGKDRPGKHDSVDGIAHLDKVINIDQSPIGRTPRSNPATYTGAFTPIRDLFASLPESKAQRLQAGPLLIQRQGRTLRGLQGRGIHSCGDAVPSRRHRALRSMQGTPLQPGGAGDSLQGQEYRRRSRHDGLHGVGVLREHPKDS